MGQRSGAETVIQMILEFLGQRTWSQSELAKKLNIGVPALRKRLDELSEAGVPFDVEMDHPHVFWSVPKNWFPGAIQLNSAELLELHRLLSRLPASGARNALLKKIGEAFGKMGPSASPVHVVRESDPEQDQFLSVLEDHIEQKKTLRLKYYSASRASVDWREASPYRVDLGPPTRFVALCHRSSELRWFRLDHIQKIAPMANEPFRPEPPDVDAFIAASLDGYHERMKPMQCQFFIAEQTARWARHNLPAGFSATPVDGGIEVAGVTAGVRPLARFVVGLGEDARAITPQLVEIVRELAAGATRTNEATGAKLKLRSTQSRRKK